MALSKTGYVFGEFTDNESEQLLNDGKELVEFSPPHPVNNSFTGKSITDCHGNNEDWVGPVFSFSLENKERLDIKFGSSPVSANDSPISSPNNDKESMKLLNVNANEFVPFNQTEKKADGALSSYPPPNHGVNPTSFSQQQPPPHPPHPALYYHPFYPPQWFPDPNYVPHFFYPQLAAAAVAAHHGYRYPFPNTGPPPIPPPPPVTTGPQVAVVAPYRTTGGDTRAQVIVSDEKIREIDYSVMDAAKSRVPPLSPNSLPSSPPASSTHGDSGIDLGQSKSVSPPSVITTSNGNHSSANTETTISSSTETPPTTNESTCMTNNSKLNYQTTPTHNDSVNESSTDCHSSADNNGTILNCSTPVVVNDTILCSSQECNNLPAKDANETTPTNQGSNCNISDDSASSPITTLIKPIGEVTPLQISSESNSTPIAIAPIDLDIVKSCDSKTTPIEIKDSKLNLKTEKTILPTRTNKITTVSNSPLELNDSKTKQDKTMPIESDTSTAISGRNSKTTPIIGLSMNKKSTLSSPNSNTSISEPITPPTITTNLKKSWASVASASTTPTKSNITAPPLCVSPLKKPVEEKPKDVIMETNKKPHVLSEEDMDRLRSLGSQIKGFSLSPDGQSVIPRGLRNSGNLCYIHAPLQALISCPSFYQLFTTLKLSQLPSETYCPCTNVTDAMIQFVSQFQIYRQRDNDHEDAKNGFKKKRPLVYEEPFRPEFIYDMLSRSKSLLSVKGRQEDAEEFLCWVLSKLHDEMVASVQSLDTPTEQKIEVESPGNDDDGKDQEEEEEEEWQEVGPRNKSVITRRTSCNESPISKMFGGKLQSTLHRQGMKETVTVEPFFSLQLDIQSSDIHTVRDALELMCTRESVSIADNDKEVGTATRRLTLAELPPYLILHIKRFYFDGSITHKIIKQVEYDQDLEIPKDLIAATSKGKISQNQRTYKLWAVIYHQGKTVDKGHYICDVYHTNASSWIRINDNYVKAIPADFVFNPARAPNPHAPYLLFYKQFEFSCINGRRM